LADHSVEAGGWFDKAKSVCSDWASRNTIIFGVLGSGLAFGLAMITIDLVGDHSHGLAPELIKLLFSSVFFGLFQGSWGWRNAFREPVPFPPEYPSAT